MKDDSVTISQRFLVTVASDLEFLLGWLSPQIREDMEPYELARLLMIRGMVEKLRTAAEEKQ